MVYVIFKLLQKVMYLVTAVKSIDNYKYRASFTFMFGFPTQKPGGKVITIIQDSTKNL